MAEWLKTIVTWLKVVFSSEEWLGNFFRPRRFPQRARALGGTYLQRPCTATTRTTGSEGERP